MCFILYTNFFKLLTDKILDDERKDLNNTGIILKGESLPVDMALVLLQEGWCTIIVINMCYCMLLLLGKFLQVVFFGNLRVSERQQIKEKVMNFIFYKFIFVFGVLNVQRAEDVVLWIVWFSVLLFLTVFCLLCRERFDYVSKEIFQLKNIYIGKFIQQKIIEYNHLNSVI